MKSLPEQIDQFLRNRLLFRRGHRLLVAVSGGLDSMVLLHTLHELSQAHGWQLTVAHFNHQLRGRSSDADERFVGKAAARLKLNFICERGDVKTFAKENRFSLEMAARKLRHQFLAETALKLKIKSIALAHHADDQVELFFLRLLRGAGTEGLAGMQWQSPSPADPAVQLIRPLLDQSKEFLREYVVSNQIQFREDASNASRDFQRNQVRLDVIPLLKKIQPALSKTVLRTMKIAAAESDFVLDAALHWLDNQKSRAFDRLPIAVQRVCLRLQLRTVGLEADFQLVESLRLHAEKIYNVDAAQSVFRDAKGIVQLRKPEAPGFSQKQVKPVLLNKKIGEIIFNDFKINWTVIKQRGDKITPKADCEVFDAGKVGEKIILRHWQKGDRFQPIGMKTPVKLQDLFINLKIPREERHKRIVGTTARGDIFWVEGLRISEAFKLDNKTQRRLKWSLLHSGAGCGSERGVLACV